MNTVGLLQYYYRPGRLRTNEVPVSGSFSAYSTFSGVLGPELPTGDIIETLPLDFYVTTERPLGFLTSSSQGALDFYVTRSRRMDFER